jgi:uncharacterized protein with FMN-binding domain
MEPQTHSNKKAAGIIIGIFGMVTVIVVTMLGARKPTDTSMTPDTSIVLPLTPVRTQVVQEENNNTTTAPVVNKPAKPAVTPTKSTPTPVASSVYRNGTYSATGTYMSPGGSDQLGVQVTLKNDIVTGVNVTLGANDRTSMRYQNIFAANYKQYVIGKDISSIHLTRVSGSSLTPIGFNNALSKIEAQAKA